MTKPSAARAVRLAGVVLFVAAALDRLLGVNSVTPWHVVLALSGVALLAASVVFGAKKVS